MRFLDGRTRASWCHREAGRVQDGLALQFLLGVGTDPLEGDTDGDGLGDAYVLSEAERTGNGGYWWTLYSGKSNGFADKEVVVNVQSFEQAVVPSRVNATCGSFCLVGRETGERYAIVLDAHDGRVVPMDYLDEGNVVRRQRKKYGHKRVNFYTCLPSVDYRGIGDLEDLFTDYQAPPFTTRRAKGFSTSASRCPRCGPGCIAFPCISTGVFGYPIRAAAEIAVGETQAFLAAHPDMEVTFCCFSSRDAAVYDQLMKSNDA